MQLVMTIWHGRSFLSQDTNLFNLVLVRWNKYEQWAPWNTILLTRDESEAHDKLEDVAEVRLIPRGGYNTTLEASVFQGL